MANLVQCKACGKEIAKGVKKCPHCGKDQRNWFMRHKILTFILAIIILAILVNMLGGDDDTATDTNTNQTAEKAPEEKVYQLNEVVKVDNAEVTVTKFEEKSVIGDPNFLGKEASEGAVLVGVQYKLKNASDKPMGMFDQPTIRLVDEKGTEYESDIEASGAYATETGIDNSKILSDLNPGITVTGTTVYEISQESFGQGKWYIQIDDQKVQIK
ncbi:hypothetical protein QFZ28_003076 [Neobacillus niacini]|uniref:DUF4352 domain-containing protein n=1 Tax=Neobacillus niacini TaxID=86668 RepID=UPI0027813EAE|nr:DUF4352 domain-containing protein [Neobacillus niacini]MDQ1002676.1 hypothetical protein [Neobacillus niacini]